jgi:hypothetical protein
MQRSSALEIGLRQEMAVGGGRKVAQQFVVFYREVRMIFDRASMVAMPMAVRGEFDWTGVPVRLATICSNSTGNNS